MSLEATILKLDVPAARVAEGLEHEHDADVCIVGSGPAGLSVAVGLLGSGLRVLLLEAGGAPEEDSARKRLGRVELVGDELYPQSCVDVTRASQLGGTIGRWSFRMDASATPPAGIGGHENDHGCRYAPLDALDFEALEARHGGWPLRRADLDPWYARAQEIAGLGPFAYEPRAWEDDDSKSLDLNPALIRSDMFQFGSASAWLDHALTRLRAAPQMQILTDAVVTRVDVASDVEARAGARERKDVASGVRFVGPDGRPGRVRARATILAGGGIENVRLLLASGGLADGDGALAQGPHRHGLGNQFDQVGRYFMEHPMVRAGLLVVTPCAALPAKLRLYDAHLRHDTLVMAKLTLSDDVVRRERLLSTALLMLARDDILLDPAVRAYQTLRSPSGRALKARARAKLALTALAGLHKLLRARATMKRHTGVDDSGWTRGPDANAVPVLELVLQTEQSPHPDNRITLAEERDAFGRRIARLHWRWTAEDRRRIARARDVYAQAFASAGYGKLVAGDWDAGQPRMIGGTHHHMGGTRMATDPRSGVVDTDCRVHGFSNLFVAGSSVFPTGGSVNPTLTIVALALRLAEHVRDRLARETGPELQPRAS